MVENEDIELDEEFEDHLKKFTETGDIESENSPEENVGFKA